MNLARMGRFAVVGVANTAIDFGVFNLLLWLSVPRAAANAAAVCVALVFSYAVNSRWTFGQSATGWRAAVPFVAVTLGGMLLNTGVVALLGDPARFPALPYAAVLVPNAAKVLGTGVSMVWNYLGYARFVFRERDGDSAA